MEPGAELQYPAGTVREQAVRDQLERIVATDLFARSERLTRFLRFVVEVTLSGKSADLKESVLACELYGRGSDFSSMVDPIVRVDARRLRDKLREYYSGFPQDSVVIELPKGTYVPVFEFRPLRMQPREAPAAGRGSWVWWIAAPVATVALLVLAFTLGSRISARRDSSGFENIRARRLTNSGNVRIAVLSPDGRRIAVVAGDPGSRSLSVRDVDGSGFQVLVPPGPDHFMGVTFSPEGAYLFFVARKPAESTGTLYTIPSGGGARHLLMRRVDSPISFSPDGSEFAFTRELPERGASTLIIAARDASREREVTSRNLPDYLDYPAWAPDGNRIACVLMYGRIRATAVLLVDLRDVSRTRQLTGGMWPIVHSLSWTADGKSLLTAGRALGSSSTTRIWLIDAVRGGARAITGSLDNYVRVNARGGRVVAVQNWLSSRVLITASNRNGEIPVGSKWTALVERAPAGSKPAGTVKVAWTANGKLVTAEGDLFLSRADGTLELRLTRRGYNTNASACGDGRHIVYTSEVEGRIELWRIDADGHNPVRLVEGDVFPHGDCSPDGSWVAYSAPGRQGWRTLWRVPIDGGQPVQLNENMAERPAISPDGRMIAVQFGDPLDGGQGRLLKVALIPASGGRQIRVLSLPGTADPRVGPRWTPDGNGIAFVDEGGPASNIWVMPMTGGRARALSYFTSDRIAAFDWSKDGRHLAVSLSGMPHEVVLIEHSR